MNEQVFEIGSAGSGAAAGAAPGAAAGGTTAGAPGGAGGARPVPLRRVATAAASGFCWVSAELGRLCAAGCPAAPATAEPGAAAAPAADAPLAGAATAGTCASVSSYARRRIAYRGSCSSSDVLSAATYL